MTKLILLRFGAALVVAAGICNHGLKRRSLSASGAIAAFCMGVVHMTCGWTFGIVLICFFLTSNKASACKTPMFLSSVLAAAHAI